MIDNLCVLRGMFLVEEKERLKKKEELEAKERKKKEKIGQATRAEGTISNPVALDDWVMETNAQYIMPFFSYSSK